MNSDRPVELSQKIDYLSQRISQVNSEIRRTDDLELRLNFQQFIDTCIREILAIKNHSSPARVKVEIKSPQKQKQYYLIENQKLEFEKKIVQFQMKELDYKQFQMQYETIKLKLANKIKDIETIEEEKADIRRQMQKNISLQKEKNRFFQQQIEKLIKLNKAQQEEIKHVKEQRNRAEKKQIQIQHKYDQQITKLGKYEEKKPKYIDRSTEGLKCCRHFMNTSTDSQKKTKKLISLKLPITLEVNKLVYGIMLGVQINSKQVFYYDKLQLYQKQATHIEQQNDYLVLTYNRRKQNVRVVLDKYRIRTGEIVIMLFGKGDSIIVHDDYEMGR